jgi:methyl-accepting chemotaxis protein
MILRKFVGEHEMLDTVNSNTVLTIFVGVTAVAFVLQLALLFLLYKAIEQSSTRLENLANRMEERATPVLATARAILEEAQPKVGEITSNLAEASATLRAHVADMAEATGEIVERARMRAAHLDDAIHSTVNKVTQTADFLQHKVITPVRRVQAIVSAVSAGMSFLNRHRAFSRNQELETAENDELFI